MKKSMLFSAVMLLSLTPAHACILTMPVSDGRPPFFELESTSKTWHGLGVVWLTQISQQMNCKSRLIELPWGRALHMLQKGQLDLMTNLTKTEERERYLDFIGPHNIEKLVLLLNKAENSVARLEDISRLSGQIAILANGFYGEEFQKLYQTNIEFRRRIVPVSSSQTMKMMLSTQRISGLIEDEQVIRQWEVRQKLLTTDFYKALTVHATPVYIGLSKKALNQGQRDQIRSWWEQAVTVKYVAD